MLGPPPLPLVKLARTVSFLFPTLTFITSAARTAAAASIEVVVAVSWVVVLRAEFGGEAPCLPEFSSATISSCGSWGATVTGGGDRIVTLWDDCEARRINRG